MSLPERTLVLVRHGQSLDNALDLFSGLRNPDLTTQGVAEASEAVTGTMKGLAAAAIEERDLMQTRGW